MELEAAPIPTLDELKARYVPKAYLIDNLVAELRTLVPLTEDELIVMLKLDGQPGSSLESLSIIKDAYATAKFLRAKSPDEIPQDIWTTAMKAKIPNQENKSMVDLFVSREFEAIVTRGATFS